MENGYIATNIVFDENTPIAINELISEAFSLNAGNNWIILNSSVNKLIPATSQVMTNQNAYIYYAITKSNILFHKITITGKINPKFKS